MRGLLTDMSNSSFTVYHDIPIMSILYLQYIAEDGVGGHALNEVVPGSLKGYTFCRAELK